VGSEMCIRDSAYIARMYNFYQSKIRTDIQKEVYKNPHFTMHLFGTEYFGVIKEKKIPGWLGAG